MSVCVCCVCVVLAISITRCYLPARVLFHGMLLFFPWNMHTFLFFQWEFAINQICAVLSRQFAALLFSLQWCAVSFLELSGICKWLLFVIFCWWKSNLLLIWNLILLAKKYESAFNFGKWLNFWLSLWVRFENYKIYKSKFVS